MKPLTKEEMKLIVGGSASTPCTNNGDCTTHITIKCNGKSQESGSGRCYDSGNGMVCHYSVAC
ncbi:MAG: hypothetical protein EKK39_02680 [Sphingobacteriales bacterium]|uniref:hypothetical protein n=1 Tax=Hydrotalea flava TaxID=714549 RepID=UPI00082D4D98|nr:hypothetical protein [Hydrotalea flava]RTL55507.1 MAG: hypothetical protein EKK39_02680 [Sphingobacteriales bacterium]